MTVRATKLEIFGFGKATGKRDSWRELSVDAQRMLNRMWQIWLCHHARNSSADKLRSHFDAYAKWQETKKGGKPKWPCVACDKHLSNEIYHTLSREFPRVNARTRVLLQNKWQGTLTSRKAASGSLPGWVAILFATESLPSFTRPQPIPFDHDNATLSEVDGKHVLTVRIERLAHSEKTAKPSVVETCELMTGKRKAASQRAIIARIIAGEYKWKGSSLLFDRGKWFAVLSYEMPERTQVNALDGNKVLWLLPRRGGEMRRASPWRTVVTSGGKVVKSGLLGGEGHHVAYARRTILRERASRKEHYRWAGSAQKGRGRKRAEAVWTKLSSRWKDFVKRYNNEITRHVVRIAEREGCGKVIYVQPMDSRRDRLFLARAGNFLNSTMTWDWFQVATLLASKCEDAGIEYETKKRGVAEDDSECVQSMRKGDGRKSKARS